MGVGAYLCLPQLENFSHGLKGKQGDALNVIHLSLRNLNDLQKISICVQLLLITL